MENELRSAVEKVRQMILETKGMGEIDGVDSIKILLSLAERYLAVDGWPKEMEQLSNPPLHDYEDGEINGFNEALRLCKLANLKEEEQLLERCSVEKLTTVISMVFASLEAPSQTVYSKDIATAIFNLIKGEEK